MRQEIAEHIDQARAEGEAGDEASTLNLLDRLGDPADIAAEARARLGVSVPKADTLEVAALVFLLVEGFFFGVGWLVGLVLLRAGGSGEACTGPVGPQAKTVCTGGPSSASQFGWTFLFFLLVLGNIAVIVYLAQRMRGRSTLAVAA